MIETNKKAIILFTRKNFYEEQWTLGKFINGTKRYFDYVRLSENTPYEYKLIRNFIFLILDIND